MQLTVPQAARLLQVPEDTVYRWIQERGLPASQFGGRYHLNRVWLLEWAHEKGIPVTLDVDDRMPSLVEALARGGVHADVPGATKPAVLQAAVDRLTLPPEVNRAHLRAMLLLRESQGSTGFGGGIAIPHSRGPILLHVPQPLVAVCYLREAVDYGAHDGRPVAAIFVLITPTIRTHLLLLARLGRLLMDPVFMERLHARADLPSLLERVRAVDAATPQAIVPPAPPAAPVPGVSEEG
jgi:PTS system nitrogen regulatory IIA component